MKLERNSVNINELEKRLNQIKHIVSLAGSGMPVEEIAAMYGVAKSSIYDIIRANKHSMDNDLNY